MRIDEVKIGERRRPLGDLEALKRSIAEIGLQNPIVVTRAKHLVSGYHRLEACRALGWEEIPATVVDLDDLRAELAEIDENLIRNELDVLERGEHFARRKEITDALEGTSTHGGDRKSEEARSSGNDFHLKSSADQIAEEIGVTARTVRQEIQIATCLTPEVKEAIRDTPLADSKTDLLQLARIKDPCQQREIAERIVSGEAKNVKDALRADRYEEKRDVSLREVIRGKYAVLYADPPWSYSNDGFSGAAAEHYPTMATADICAMPIEDVAADDCVLFMWATNPLLEDAMRVIKSWGFAYKTNLVWVKNAQTNMGFYCYGKHELLLVATRGSLPPVRAGLRASVIEAPRSEHSRKPEEIYALIEGMYPGMSYLELFARRKRQGWTTFGNEAEVAP